MWACARGKAEACVMLYQWNHHAISLKNKEGLNPVEIAKAYQQQAIAESLETLENHRQSSILNDQKGSILMEQQSSSNSSSLRGFGSLDKLVSDAHVFAVPSRPVVSGKRPHSELSSDLTRRLSIEIPPQHVPLHRAPSTQSDGWSLDVMSNSPKPVKKTESTHNPLLRHITKRSSIEVLPYSSMMGTTQSTPEQLAAVRREMNNVKAASEPRHVSHFHALDKHRYMKNILPCETIFFMHYHVELWWFKSTTIYFNQFFVIALFFNVSFYLIFLS